MIVVTKAPETFVLVRGRCRYTFARCPDDENLMLVTYASPGHHNADFRDLMVAKEEAREMYRTLRSKGYEAF